MLGRKGKMAVAEGMLELLLLLLDPTSWGGGVGACEQHEPL